MLCLKPDLMILHLGPSHSTPTARSGDGLLTAVGSAGWVLVKKNLTTRPA